MERSSFLLETTKNTKRNLLNRKKVVLETSNGLQLFDVVTDAHIMVAKSILKGSEEILCDCDCWIEFAEENEKEELYKLSRELSDSIKDLRGIIHPN